MHMVLRCEVRLEIFPVLIQYVLFLPFLSCSLYTPALKTSAYAMLMIYRFP
jgi:hypothetical protein